MSKCKRKRSEKRLYDLYVNKKQKKKRQSAVSRIERRVTKRDSQLLT